jgi:hypothetical protein
MELDFGLDPLPGRREPISADIDVGGHLVAKTGIKPEIAFICEIGAGSYNSFSVKLCF